MDLDPRDYTDERDPRDSRDRDDRDRVSITMRCHLDAARVPHRSSRITTTAVAMMTATRHATAPTIGTARTRVGRNATANPVTATRADVFTRSLNLPRERDREIVRDSRGREYTLRGSQSRSLATVGAFRVMPARDLRDRDDRPGDPRKGDLRHLREQGLIETVRIPGYREQAVVLTDRGRDVLEANRDRDRDTGQAFTQA